MTPTRRRPDLSDRDLLVMRFLADTGLATTDQLERLAFPASHGTQYTAARRARRTLARLVDQGQLSRLDRRVGGVRSGSTSYVYQLATGGRRSLGLPRRGRTYEPGALFISHTLAAADVHVELLEAERRGDLVDLNVEHEPTRRFATPSGIERLTPDLLVEVTTADGWELRWFVEIDRGTEHLPTVLRKCRTYERYWRSGSEADHHEVFPRVLWSVPDKRRGRAIETAIVESRGLAGDLHRVATAEDTAAVITNSNDNPEGGQP